MKRHHLAVIAMLILLGLFMSAAWPLIQPTSINVWITELTATITPTSTVTPSPTATPTPTPTQSPTPTPTTSPRLGRPAEPIARWALGASGLENVIWHRVDGSILRLEFSASDDLLWDAASQKVVQTGGDPLTECCPPYQYQSPDGRWRVFDSRVGLKCLADGCWFDLLDTETNMPVERSGYLFGELRFYRWAEDANILYYTRWPPYAAAASSDRWGLYALDPASGEATLLLENAKWVLAGPDPDTAWVLRTETHPGSGENALQIGLYDMAAQQWRLEPYTLATGGIDLALTEPIWDISRDQTRVAWFDTTTHRLYLFTADGRYLLADDLQGDPASQLSWSPDSSYLLATLEYTQTEHKEFWVFKIDLSKE